MRVSFKGGVTEFRLFKSTPCQDVALGFCTMSRPKWCPVCDKKMPRSWHRHIVSKTHLSLAKQRPVEAAKLQKLAAIAKRGRLNGGSEATQEAKESEQCAIVPVPSPVVTIEAVSVQPSHLLASPVIAHAYLYLRMITQAVDLGLTRRVLNLCPKELDIALGMLAITQRNPTDWDDTYHPRRTRALVDTPPLRKEDRILCCLSMNHQLLLDWRAHSKSKTVLPFLENNTDTAVESEDIWRSHLRTTDDDLSVIMDFLTSTYNRTQYEVYNDNLSLQNRMASPRASYIYLYQNNILHGELGVVLFVRNWNRRWRQKAHLLYTLDPCQPGVRKEPVGTLYLEPWTSDMAALAATANIHDDGGGLLQFRGEYVGEVDITTPEGMEPGSFLRNGLYSGTHASWIWNPYTKQYISDRNAPGKFELDLSANDPRVAAALKEVCPLQDDASVPVVVM